MAGGKSVYAQKASLDLFLGAAAYTPPGTVYIALSKNAWAASSIGSSLNEPSGGAYARVAVTNNSTNWAAATQAGADPSKKSNSTDIIFPTPTAAWGTIKSIYVVDAASSGNVIFGADLAVWKDIATGDDVLIPAGLLIWLEGTA